MELLVGQGKIRYVGSSNFAGWQLVAAQEAAARRRRLGIVSEQCAYSLFVRHPELEVIPAARAYGIGVLVWSPLHGGLLSGAVRKMREGTAVKSAQGRAASALRAHRETIAAYERFCAEAGRDPAVTGLAWIAARPGVNAVVTGPRTPAHIDGAVRALNTALEPDELLRLEELFPPVGCGGTGPDAWLDDPAPHDVSNSASGEKNGRASPMTLT
jgi:NDP-hexose 2,3-enoyl reductase